VAADLELVRAIRCGLSELGDPERALAQQRYMKSEIPFRGVTLPQLRGLLRPLLRNWQPVSRPSWKATVLELWDNVAYREERYAALTIAEHKTARQWLDVKSVPLFRHLIVTGAWWDHVDEVAQHLLGVALADHRSDLTPVVYEWATDGELWVRRAAVVCQVGHRDVLDEGLLRHVVEANIDDTSFWLRKAIGWALRDYARVNPNWVRAEVVRLGGRLSGFSRREAMKHLG